MKISETVDQQSALCHIDHDRTTGRDTDRPSTARGAGGVTPVVLLCLAASGYGLTKARVDIATAATIAVAIVVASWLAIDDARHLRLRNSGVVTLVLSASIVIASGGRWSDAALAAVVTSAPLLAMNRWSHRVGFGDVKFAAAAAALVGGVSLAAGLIMATALYFVAGLTAGRTHGPRPLGPVIMLATSLGVVALALLPEAGPL